MIQSGNSFKSGGISKKGNAHIRKALFIPALSASRYNNLSQVFYEQLKERQGAKMQGIIAIARKLLLLIYSLWKNETQYDPNRNLEQRLALNKHPELGN